jgi:hypothetical protein
MKNDNRDLEFADEVGKKESITFDKFSKSLNQVSEEDIKCELQLSILGDWEQLDFKIDNKKFQEDEKNLKQWYRPFQPKKGILNDRESILLYGLKKDDKPTEPTGLAQIFAKLGYMPKESEFKFPTEAKEKLTCCKEIFDWFGDWGRCFIIKLNAGGFYPHHRDHFLLHRDTIRLIAFIGDATNKLEWEVGGNIMKFQPNSLYYVNTAKLHRLSAWQHNCNMVVFNLPKTWDSITKLSYKIKGW